ncbi:CYTH and CHAD domain-containing protein [Xylophilus sp. ASV27]|uniref:CYTH and CHAD domain-containing protein n=1 Tax=Xylophilus sp. ASV27 TaxID=2795129 RepID=UPI0018EAD425|nr:CYTH and CHAD domain-containing protein [Xylophilus sp. ASV27]
MEFEFKFQIPPERLPAVEAALRRGAVQRVHLQARYFDTADGALAAHGMVLRLRKEGRRWVQTAKAAGAGPLQRLEHEVDLGAARAAASAVPDLRLHQGTAVGARLQQVLGAEPVLLETYGTDIWRQRRVVRVGRSMVELALDVGQVNAPAVGGGRRVSPVCELELELVQGDAQALAGLARRWAQRHGLWLSTLSKAERGERLRAGAGTVPAVKARAPEFPAQPSGRAIQQAVLAACLAQVLPGASEVAAGNTDAEQLHQLRIGIRRLRTALRALAPLAPGLDPAWEAPLVQVFRVLGTQRDREQALGLVQPLLQAAGGPPVQWPAEDDATAARPGEAVRAPAFQAVLIELVGFAAAEAAAPGLDAAAARRALRRQLRRLQARVLEDAARFTSLAPEAQHRTRRRLKRLRYLAEFVAPLWGKAKDAATYLQALRPAQDLLGRQHDEAVACGLYRAAAMQDPRAWFGAGWLAARQPEGARACAEALGRIAGAAPFWKKHGGKRN